MSLLALVSPSAAAGPQAEQVAFVSYEPSDTFFTPVDVFTTPDGARRRALGGGVDGWQVAVLDTSIDRLLTYEVDQGVTRSRLVVRDVTGAAVRVIAQSADPSGLGNGELSLSGNRVAWREGQGAEVRFRSTTVAPGPVADFTVGTAVLGFVGEDLVVLSSSDGPVTVPVDGGSALPVRFAGAPSQWGELNPAGNRLVGSASAGLAISSVSRRGDVVTVGPPVPLTIGKDHSPDISADGARVVFVRGLALEGDGDVFQVALAGGVATPLGPRTGAVETAVSLAALERVAPAALRSIGPLMRAGTTATIQYAVPADPTASVVIATRTSPGLPVKTLRAVVPSPLVDSGVSTGRTYTYSVRQVDRSGNVGPATTAVLRKTAPAAAVRVSGQQLTAGQFLRSANGVRLRVNPDGNLVVLSPGGKVLFQTRTRGTRPVLRVNADGNVVLLSGSRVLWQTRTAGQGTAALVAQDDGNTVLYRDRDGRAVWSSRSGRTY